MTVAGYCLAVGFLIPIWIACLAGSYILATFILNRFSRTVLGTHIRHVFVRLAPPKIFHPEFNEDDRTFVRRVMIDSLKDDRILKAIREGVRE